MVTREKLACPERARSDLVQQRQIHGARHIGGMSCRRRLGIPGRGSGRDHIRGGLIGRQIAAARSLRGSHHPQFSYRALAQWRRLRPIRLGLNGRLQRLRIRVILPRFSAAGLHRRGTRLGFVRRGLLQRGFHSHGRRGTSAAYDARPHRLYELIRYLELCVASDQRGRYLSPLRADSPGGTRSVTSAAAARQRSPAAAARQRSH